MNMPSDDSSLVLKNVSSLLIRPPTYHKVQDSTQFVNWLSDSDSDQDETTAK